MDFKTFIFVYFAIVFSGSLAVTGWYFITRGEKKIMEDGSEKRIGKVFKNWFFFWTKEHPWKKNVYFDEAHAFDLLLKIRPKFHKVASTYDIDLKGTEFIIGNYKDWTEEIKWIEGAYDVKFKKKGEGIFRVYKEYEEFVYPYWVRDPIAVCATCFSSIYGSIYYWVLIALVKENLFEWSTVPWLAAVCFWIAFCFSLSVINTALAKRFN